jgi:hypothetical protein
MNCRRWITLTNKKPRRSGARVGAELFTACGARSRDRQGRRREARAWQVRERNLWGKLCLWLQECHSNSCRSGQIEDFPFQPRWSQRPLSEMHLRGRLHDLADEHRFSRVVVEVLARIRSFGKGFHDSKNGARLVAGDLELEQLTAVRGRAT